MASQRGTPWSWKYEMVRERRGQALPEEVGHRGAEASKPEPRSAVSGQG